MPSPKLRAIIFDIGRVLIRVNVARATSALAEGLSLSPEEIWSALEKDPRWKDWQEGRISPRDWHLHVAKRLGSKLTFEQFVEVWNGALDPRPILDDSFLERLGKRYRLAVLSNTDPLHVVHMEQTYEFLEGFPVRIYSCRVGASKPNPLIYKEALKGCKVRAQQAVYVDDIPAYAQAAEQLGMRGIVFQSSDQLFAALRTLGVGFK
ncbi:MAG TPA: HAD family phosphatase [Candidatus Dormibacteraeota bacterium]|nr:HAD family phosphatase [Candidatus Dormibacteraeota bacterium]